MDDAFVARIADEGILTPLRITESSVIISGWRRRQAAVALDLGVVPVWIEAGLTEDSIVLRLLESNAERSKSLIERLREFRAYKELNEQEMTLRLGLERSVVPNRLLLEAKFRAAVLAAKQAGLPATETKKALDLLALVKQAKPIRMRRMVIAELLTHSTVTAAHEHAIACGLLRKGARNAGSFNQYENSKTE